MNSFPPTLKVQHQFWMKIHHIATTRQFAQEDKGPSAKEVMLLGSAGNQVQQMKAMGYGGYTWGKGDWGGKGWGGKGWDWGGKGYGGYDVYMPMQMPIPWGKGGYGKGGFGW